LATGYQLCRCTVQNGVAKVGDNLY
jgi:hypothetical protein